MGVMQRAAELAALYRFRKGRQEEEVASLVLSLNEGKRHVEALLGHEMIGKDILEIGPGPYLKQARFYGIGNRVTAIDLDQIELKGAGDWLRLWSKNGTTRFLKTLGRKLAGIDRDFFRAYYAALPGTRGVRVNFMRKDAARTGFADGSFDVTLSTSVLEHIPEPAKVLAELARLTRPGGVFLHLIHIYTSDSGAHDPRSFARQDGDFPYWCHLRPSVVHRSAPNCYVNKVPLSEWIEACEEALPGCRIQRIPEFPDPRLLEVAGRLRQEGELRAWSDDDLLTDCLLVSWVRPAATR